MPLSSENATHTDPSKNSIDQALKSLKSKEQSSKSVLLFRFHARQSTSLIAYQPREAHKKSHKAVAFPLIPFISGLLGPGSPNPRREGACPRVARALGAVSRDRGPSGLGALRGDGREQRVVCDRLCGPHDQSGAVDGD